MENENIQELKFQVGEAWKGVYSSSTAYGLANVVQDPTGLSVYRSLKSGNVGHPVSDRTWWFCIIDLSSIKEESDRIAALNQAIAQDEALRVAAEELRQQHEAERVAAENKRNETEQARISAEQARVNAESARATAEQQRITAEQGRVSAESARVQAEQARALAETLRANAEDARAAAEINRNAAEQQRIANEQARETQYASDHTRAEADHETAVQDNAQMTELVERADADHVQAASDHTRADSDHATAASDHTQAEQDHTTAAADHTQAGNDNTRAESDHTRAESDHAAVEVYVDSLGVFDLSKHNAVGGVLATYADLSAALTALNALDSKYKYGGMSFKFVQSSDNKYVKFFCTADEFTTDITKWQGFENIKYIIDGAVGLHHNINKWIDGYINSSGDIVVVDNTFRSYYVPISKDYKVTVNSPVSPALNAISFFRKQGDNYVFVEGVSGTGSDSLKPYSYTAGEDGYLVFSISDRIVITAKEDTSYIINFDVDTCADDVPTSGSQHPVKSGGVYNAIESAVNSLLGYRIFQDSQVQTNKYIRGDDGTIVSGGDRYRLAKFYMPIDYVVRIIQKTTESFRIWKYTSSSYSSEGATSVSTSNPGLDKLAELTAGYYAISWYSDSITTALIPDEVVVYSYKNVSYETTKVKNNLDLINGKVAYTIYNQTVGETFERTITPVSNNWTFNENINAGRYELTLTPKSSIHFYDAANNDILSRSGLNGTTTIELSTNVVKVSGYSTNASLSFKLVPLYSHAYRIGVLEEKVGDGILFYNPTEVYEPLISSTKYGRVINGSSKKSCISLLHFSDIHGNATNVARLMNFKDKYSSYINDVICTGDIVTDKYQDTDILSGYENMLIALGNHDAWIRTYDEDLAERQEGSSSIWVVKPTYCYNKYFAPNISNWNVTQPTDTAADGKCYYYKDYTVGSAKLRLIVLDCMHYNVGSDLVDNVSVQNTWLESVLADAITNNLPVVIAVHYWPAWINVNDTIKCSYTTTDHIGSDYMPPLLSSTVATFINNGGEFVCYISGHSHSDVIATVHDYPDQMFITVDTANNSNLLGNSLGVGKGRDCFNIISFDVNDKLVKVVRVGRDTCTNLAIKRRLVYRYKQFTDDFGTHNAGLELSE